MAARQARRLAFMKEKLLQKRLERYKNFCAEVGHDGQNNDYFHSTANQIRRSAVNTDKARKNLVYLKRLSEGKVVLKGNSIRTNPLGPI
ncbi:hypothetical protein B566_EDAN012420 [Ephemera danica]|nr:hypothetical protein B566_EDAN012420 [Ephemera danica]